VDHRVCLSRTWRQTRGISAWAGIGTKLKETKMKQSKRDVKSTSEIETRKTTLPQRREGVQAGRGEYLLLLGRNMSRAECRKGRGVLLNCN